MAIAENRESSGEKGAKPRGQRRRYLAAFLAGVVLACGVAYVVQMEWHGGAVPIGRGGLSTAREAGKKDLAERLEVVGVANCHRVSEGLYRGAQPSAEGMQELKKLGIRTVVNLRSVHSDRNEIGDTGLGYEHIEMVPWDPDDEDVVRFLKIVTDERLVPVFVHCRRGADRTGTMCAIYRVVVEGWSRAEAVEEMTKGGFGYYSGWESLVEYIENVDIEELKERAGLKD